LPYIQVWFFSHPREVIVIRHCLWIFLLAAFIGACDDDSTIPLQNTPPADAPKAKLRAKPAGASRMLQVLVTDKETGTAIGNEKITIYVNDHKTNTTTDFDGVYFIPLPETGLTHVSFHARPKGYVPTMMRWSEDGKELTDLPEDYILAVEKGTQLSGILKDDAGNPVVGAKVMLWWDSYWGVKGEHPNFVHNSFKTDETGRWTCDIAPSQCPPVRITFYPAPQGYILTSNVYGDTPIEKFRDGTAEAVLQRIPSNVTAN
jgi:hypothetical protein